MTVDAVPPGIRFIQKVRKKDISYVSYRNSVLILTFVAYVCYHASRKPPSIVKGVLDPEEKSLDPNVPAAANLGDGWAPFNGRLGKGLLGEMDVAFLLSYALGMYYAGHLGDRLDLRLFLSGGMVASGFFVCLFGMGYFWGVHRLWYFLGVQMVAGLLQATGWPSVVSIMANWYGKKRRGLILGIWNAHTSCGNILGSLVASAALGWGWGWAFILPGVISMIGGLTMFLFLTVSPDIVGYKSPASSVDLVSLAEPGATSKAAGGEEFEDEKDQADLERAAEATLAKGAAAIPAFSDNARLLGNGQAGSSPKMEAIGFLEAWRIPGVASFALCLFFAKLVAYTFLYWLPFYIRHTEIQGVYLSTSASGILSTVFDLGGILGGVLAGHLSDSFSAQATVAASFMLLAIPFMALYLVMGHLSLAINIALLSLSGFFVNGPYALITCAVSADLGQHSSLKGNARALATVTAIIDGTGSLGAALGPFLTGFVSEIGQSQGWTEVFAMLMVSALAASLCLVRLVKAEYDSRRAMAAVAVT